MSTQSPAAILFDMDGTLTRPRLDFDAIRREMGLPAGISILDGIALVRASEPARVPALEAILFRHEHEAALAAEPNEGAIEVVRDLVGRGLRCGIVTRNAAGHTRTTLDRLGMPIEVAVAREHAPPKPAPDPVLLACEQLGLPAAATWFVGDWRDDILAGEAAGCSATVLITNGRAPSFEHRATHTIERLSELLSLL